MEQPMQSVCWVDSPNQRCPKNIKLITFKNISKSVINSLSYIHFPKGRRWIAEDIIAILAYSWIKGVSIHHACEKLNAWAVQAYPMLVWTYADRRHRRLYPHQTTVNAWLRLLSLQDAKDISRAIFKTSLKRFFFRNKRKKRVVLEFDLTYLGYWGKRRDRFIKGSKMVKGTRRIRHYHAAMVHGSGVSLFVGLQHVAKGESKVPFMIETAQWLINMGFQIEFCIVDREYYRQGVLNDIKQLGIDVITPAKEYKRLDVAKQDYLLGRKTRVQQYFLNQGSKTGRKPKKVRCWIVLQARGTQRIDEIKRDFKEGRKTLKSASAQMYALITTWAPQYAGSRFPMLVRRIYKMRWQIETAFRDNEIHKAIWRSNYDGTRFIGEFGRYLLFNNWQIAKVEDFRKDRFPFQMYRDELIDKESGFLNL